MVQGIGDIYVYVELNAVTINVVVSNSSNWHCEVVVNNDGGSGRSDVERS